MEHIQEIDIIITNYNSFLSKKSYKLFIKIIDNLKENFISKTISDSVFESFCIILLNTIENIKHNIRDIDYINYMNSLNSVIKIFKYNDNNYYDDDDDDYYNYNHNDDENIINMDLFTDRIEYNTLILEDFIKENNLSNDFLNSSFNIVEVAAYNYVNYNCLCDDNNIICNKFMLCKNIQKYILNNPLTFILMNNNIDNICEDINKYNLFSFDGKINSLFHYNDNHRQISLETEINIQLLIKIFHLNHTRQLAVLSFINIFNYIYTKEYMILNNTDFRNTLYDKIKDLQDHVHHVEFWINKLNLDSNIIDKINNSILEYFPVKN
jgi:hypothetical protein